MHPFQEGITCSFTASLVACAANNEYLRRIEVGSVLLRTRSRETSTSVSHQ
ncbi:hypothetical protein [Streptomyces sp. NPDC020817]|uniref:hypothetical protein n=1 Tax=Streptomyces sp. NPDC020817 TaxID=3365095 RepID=UPI003794FED9